MGSKLTVRGGRVCGYGIIVVEFKLTAGVVVFAVMLFLETLLPPLETELDIRDLLLDTLEVVVVFDPSSLPPTLFPKRGK